MRRLVLALLATAAFTQVASAADLPAKVYTKAPAMVAPAYNWTGLYIGINGGGAWGKTGWTYVAAGTTADHNTSGGLVGGTLGYNWQMNNIVLGLEGDWDWANISGSTTCPNPAFTCNSKLTSLGTLRARLGFAAWDRALLYVTGGWAWGNNNINTVSAATGTVGTSTTRSGGTFGLGAEFALWDNWTGKVEWLNYNLGTGTYTVDTALQVNASTKGNLLRAGLNYRFGGL